MTRMKYMGSKRAMLKNGLGVLLNDEAKKHTRFFDLFSGSGAVASHVARTQHVPVFAYDLQSYSAEVAGAVIERTAAFDPAVIWAEWDTAARRLLSQFTVPDFDPTTADVVRAARGWAGRQTHLPITAAYGGHYFSPAQSAWLDALRATLPEDPKHRRVALAALIHVASQCAAAPGHTAQPFQPSPTALPYLREAWSRVVHARVEEVLAQLAAEHAIAEGKATVGDANEAALQLEEGDLAFIDPPYSGVHYSRFYHVLETISHGECGEVSGVGRYPVAARRPRSDYSMRGSSAEALANLLQRVASGGATAILTFPDHTCSNGLSGDAVRDIAAAHFKVSEFGVHSRFSTLGGYSSADERQGGRMARQNATELVLVLRP